MSYTVRIARQAEAYLRKLDEPMKRRIVERLKQIAENPYGAHSKVLTNAGGRRSSRVGAYRIVFGVQRDQSVVDVYVIAPRGRAYRDS